MRIPGECWQVLWFIIRKTYGFKKKSDFISVQQISDATGLKRQNAHRALHKLEQMNVVNVVKATPKTPLVVALNKDYDVWKSVIKSDDRSKNNLSSKRMQTVIKSDDRSVIKSDDNNIYIDNNNKKKYETLRDAMKNSDAEAFLIIKFFTLTLDEHERRRYLPATSNWKAKYNWLNTLKLLHNNDGYPYWEIFDVIYHARVTDAAPDKSGFCWKDQVLSIPGLRNQSKDHKFDKIHRQIRKDMYPPQNGSLDYIKERINKYAGQIG